MWVCGCPRTQPVAAQTSHTTAAPPLHPSGPRTTMSSSHARGRAWACSSCSYVFAPHLYSQNKRRRLSRMPSVFVVVASSGACFSPSIPRSVKSASIQTAPSPTKHHRHRQWNASRRARPTRRRYLRSPKTDAARSSPGSWMRQEEVVIDPEFESMIMIVPFCLTKNCRTLE